MAKKYRNTCLTKICLEVRITFSVAKRQSQEAKIYLLAKKKVLLGIAFLWRVLEEGGDR